MSAVPDLRVVVTPVTNVERIIELEARSEAREEGAVADKYEAARLIAEELEVRGVTTRDLGREIGKSPAHVVKMNRVHREFGGEPRVKTIPEWNELYNPKSAAPAKAPEAPIRWPKPLPSVEVRTPGGYLAEGVLVIRYALRGISSDEVARALIAVVGENAFLRAAGLEAPEDDAEEVGRRRRANAPELYLSSEDGLPYADGIERFRALLDEGSA